MSLVKFFSNQHVQFCLAFVCFLLAGLAYTQRWDLKFFESSVQRNEKQRERYPVNPDAIREAPDFEKKCEREAGIACLYIGGFYELGIAGVLDEKRARLLMRRGCSSLTGAACHHLGRMYEDGIGGEVDLKLADLHYAQACYLDQEDACLLMGRRLVRRTGSEQDLFVGFQMLDKACDSGKSEACKEAAVLRKHSESNEFLENGARRIAEIYGGDET